MASKMVVVGEACLAGRADVVAEGLSEPQAHHVPTRPSVQSALTG